MSGAPKESLGAQGLPGLGKACLTTMDKKLNMLNEKVDKLLHFQEDVTPAAFLPSCPLLAR